MPSLNRYISDEDFAHLLEDAKKIQETNPEIKRMIYEHMDYTRRKYNFTQKEFSQILGCSNTTYSHIMQDLSLIHIFRPFRYFRPRAVSPGA